MLHEFLSSNREELIRRCRAKVRKRAAPPVSELELEHGVPLFLEQLVEALRREQEKPPRRGTATSAENSRTAALHGKELRGLGYTAGQVVQDYADIGEAIAELAEEQRASVSIDDAYTLSRFLDSAIADAVASFGGGTKARELFARP